MRSALRAARRLRQLASHAPVIRLAHSGRKIAMRSSVRGLIKRGGTAGGTATIRFAGGAAHFVEVGGSVQVRFELGERAPLLAIAAEGDGVSVHMTESLDTRMVNLIGQPAREYADSVAGLQAIEYIPADTLEALLPRLRDEIYGDQRDRPVVHGDVTVTRTDNGLKVRRDYASGNAERSLEIAQRVIAGYLGSADAPRDGRSSAAIARLYERARPWFLRTITAAQARLPLEPDGRGEVLRWTRRPAVWHPPGLEFVTYVDRNGAHAHIWRKGQELWRMTVTRSKRGVETVLVEGMVRVDAPVDDPQELIPLLERLPHLNAGEREAVAAEIPNVPRAIPHRVPHTVMPIDVTLSHADGPVQGWTIAKTLQGRNVARRLLRAELSRD